MSNHDDIWSQAIQEAYASAPVEEVILSTLELRHPSFGEDVIRVVSDHGDIFEVEGQEVEGHYLTLEDDAPANPGENVFFQSLMFSMSLPEQKEGTLPSIQIEIDNVSKKIVGYLDQAVGLRAPIEITYREFISSDRTSPDFVLGGLHLTEVSSNMTRVTGTAQFSDLMNKSFPKKVYRPNEFRGLLQ